jgi:hypothetical protein
MIQADMLAYRKPNERPQLGLPDLYVTMVSQFVEISWQPFHLQNRNT